MTRYILSKVADIVLRFLILGPLVCGVSWFALNPHALESWWLFLKGKAIEGIILGLILWMLVELFGKGRRSNGKGGFLWKIAKTSFVTLLNVFVLILSLVSAACSKDALCKTIDAFAHFVERMGDLFSSRQWR